MEGTGRDGVFLPKVNGGPEAWNSAGEQLLMEIMTDPDADFKQITSGRFKGGYTIISNMIIDGRNQFVGVTYGPSGNVEFFGAYPSQR